MTMPRNGLPRYCCLTPDRHGKRRVRFRKAGFSTYLPSEPMSEEFMRAYAAALDGVKAKPTPNIGAQRTVPGSLDSLIAHYYRSAEFANLAPSTQTNRRRVLEHLREKHGKNPIARLERKHVRSIIGTKANTPAAANELLKVLRMLGNFAVREDMIPSNPALGVTKFKTLNPDGVHTWTEDDVMQFKARHPIGSKARLALALALYTGQRRSDVAKMGWQHIQGDAIAVRQKKTKTPLLIPLHPDLADALNAMPRTNLTFLVTEFGQSFSDAGLGKFFRKRCDEAGLPQCSLHGLRKLTATRLADLGCSVHQIMAVTGHRSMDQVAPYTRAADQKRLARQAMDRQAGRAEHEQKMSNLDSGLDSQSEKPRKINPDSVG